jgi:hypothetical protein
MRNQFIHIPCNEDEKNLIESRIGKPTDILEFILKNITDSVDFNNSFERLSFLKNKEIWERDTQPNQTKKITITYGMIKTIIFEFFGKSPTEYFIKIIKESSLYPQIIKSKKAAKFLIEKLSKESGKDFNQAIAILTNSTEAPKIVSEKPRDYVNKRQGFGQLKEAIQKTDIMQGLNKYRLKKK